MNLLRFSLFISFLLLPSSLVRADSEQSVQDFHPETWSLHFQATVVTQGHQAFPALYSGMNSLHPTEELATSLTSTLFLGRKLWKNGELYFNPEVSGGKGLSSTLGVAGFPNGEVYRVGSPSPKANLSRLYLKQIFGLGSETERIEADKNQLAAEVPVKRLTLIAGKFSLNDFFDGNTYSHDPRTQFLNWALMDDGAWDYAADTRGYTLGVYLEYHGVSWSLRIADTLVPKEANRMELDTNLGQAHSDQFELEHRHQIGSHLGAVRFLGFLNHAHMGSYSEATSEHVNVSDTRAYRTKYGIALNAEQELTAELGAFFRAGWNEGKTESWAFTEIDRTVTFGLNLKGAYWHRSDDVFGLAYIINGLSSDHATYLASGEYGFIIGDGALNYAPEEIVETYYLWKPLSYLGLTADFQFVNNPAYNQDRGPTFVYAGRVHLEF